MMNFSPRYILVLVIAALAGLAIGLLAPWSWPPREHRAPGAPVPASAPAAIPTDPVATAAALAFSGHGLREAARLGPLLAQLDSAQTAALLDLLERKASLIDPDILAAIVTSWTKRDPAAVAAWMQPRLHARFSRPLITGESFTIAEAWAQADPEAALRQAREHPQQAFSAKLLLAAALGLADGNPAARFDVIQQFPAGLTRREAVEDFVAHWMVDAPPEDARTAVSLAAKLPVGPERQAVLDLALPRLAATSPLEALDLATQSQLETRHIWDELFGLAAKVDAPAAAARLEVAGGRFLEEHAATVAEAWTKQDLPAALDWAAEQGVLILRSLDDPNEITDWKYHELVANALGRTDAFFGSDPFREDTVKSVLSVAFADHPAGTVAWLRALPAGPDRERWIELAARRVPSTSALAVVDSLVPLLLELSPEAAAKSVGAFTGSLVAAAPDQAARWAASLPPGPASTAAWASLGWRLPNLPEPPAGPDRDAFLNGQIGRMANSSELFGTAGLTAAQFEPVEKQLFGKLSAIGDLEIRKRAFDTAFQRAEENYANVPYADETLGRAPVPEAWKAPWRAKLQAAAAAVKKAKSR